MTPGIDLEGAPLGYSIRINRVDMNVARIQGTGEKVLVLTGTEERVPDVDFLLGLGQTGLQQL